MMLPDFEEMLKDDMQTSQGNNQDQPTQGNENPNEHNETSDGNNGDPPFGPFSVPFVPVSLVEDVEEHHSHPSTSTGFNENGEVLGMASSSFSGNEGSSELNSLTTTTTSGGDSLRSHNSSVGTVLPWGAHKERSPYLPCVNIDMDIRPGEYVMRTLFADFTIQAEKKMETVMTEPPERPLSKVLQRGEDPQFDQLLTAFGTVAEHCLPSILRALFAWYERQLAEASSTEQRKTQEKAKRYFDSLVSVAPSSSTEVPERSEADILHERRDLAVEFIFCLVVIEVLKQLHIHPGQDDLVQHIENIAFKHFKYREGIQSGPNAANIHIIADLYAEVIGALAQSRFQSVRKRFIAELKELRAKEPSSHTTQSIISLLMGMKFFRVKMVPIEEFEASFQFMQECAQYFLEVKDKDIKHALAGLFVEILVPVAATVKNEVNVPCLKNFVESLYSLTLDMCTKSKHRLALFPLLTCLLCVSQKIFFLQNWHCFLAMCLSHLKNRDAKMCRVGLESLYRLLWVYMIRIKCESNSATQSRLQSIVNSLFPKGSKTVVPRDSPLNIFVKIIQFIAQERLDFAMREIVFDLLLVGRPIKIILTPERMSIGLRAFLVVADSLQQKEGEPPMPRTMGVLPSGNTLRVKKTYLNKMLTEDTARSIGMSSYFPHVRRVFVDILRALDVHYGRPLMMTSTQNVNKEPDEMITGERKPRIDLFRTCVAAVPRLIPDSMTGAELVDLLARLTVHMDEELRALAYRSLETLVLDFPDWRQDVVSGFTQFLTRDVHDTFPQLVDNGLRMLLQLLTSWKNAITGFTAVNISSSGPTPSNVGLQSGVNLHIRDIPSSKRSDLNQEPVSGILHQVEGFALVMLCNCRLNPRRLAVHILREAKTLLRTLAPTDEEPSVIDVIDRSCVQVVNDKCLHMLPPAEKAAVLSMSNIDLQWLADRNNCVWTAGFQDENSTKTGSSLNLSGQDPWSSCLLGFLERDRVLGTCPTAVTHSWPIVYARVISLFGVIDPSPVNDNRASLLRSSTTTRKPVNERDIYLHIWKNYVTLAFRVVPPVPSPVVRCASPDLSLSSSPDSLTMERTDTKTPVSPSELYKRVVPLLRSEAVDVRDAAVDALGKVNPDALKDLLEELVVYIREAVDRKQENMRRRRRRDALRLQLVRVLELVAEYGTFGISSCVLDHDSHTLHPSIVEYIDGARLYLESEADKDAQGIRDTKLHFCNFIRKMVKSFPLETWPTLLGRTLRKHLFNLFAGWSELYSSTGGSGVNSWIGGVVGLGGNSDHEYKWTPQCTELQMSALQAMSAVLCCGPCFDPNGLAEDDCYYAWLNMLLASQDDRLYVLGRDTVVLLLECNPDIGQLLDWVVDKCYTGSTRVADGCFLSLATVFSAKEYPCDHYIAVINVTLMCTGCPRTNVHETALQLLQVLDKRFFGTVSPLSDIGGDKSGDTLDLLLSTTYCRSQMYLSRQLANIHPELTMPMFSEITHRFQTARPEVRQLLLQYLLPWFNNMELVDPNVPPANPLSYFQYYANELNRSGSRREGWGSAEATEMVLNNLFYLTAKFADSHPKEIEELWATLCSCWPNNLKVIIRYLIIVSGMSPQELLPSAKRVVVYLARYRPDRLLDEMMTELQTVETLNCLIERTQTPPFYRLTSMRKASSHSEGPGGATCTSGETPGKGSELTVEKGTIHTKRHSGEDPGKTGTSKSDSALRALAAGGYAPPLGTRHEKGRTASGPPMVQEDLLAISTSEAEISTSDETHGNMLVPSSSTPGPGSCLTVNISVASTAAPNLSPAIGGNPIIHMPSNTSPCGHATVSNVRNFDIPQPHPLPMPEYGGYFAPLTEFLPDSSQPIAGFHRCNVAVMLLTDVVVDGVDLDWSIHVPLMLHILFLGLDHNRSIVHEHCKQLLLNLLVVLGDHRDHLTVARILLNSKTIQLGLGIATPPLPVLQHIFTEPETEFDSYLQGAYPTGHQAPSSPSGNPLNNNNSNNTNNFGNSTEASMTTSGHGTGSLSVSSSTPTPSVIITPDDGTSWTGPQPGPNMPIQDVIKSIIDFLAARKNQPLWNYEDITAKVWSIRSVEQLDIFLQHVVRVFRDSLPHALISERWSQTALQLGLSCSSRHYAGRSLQLFRALRMPITSRMLSDILSRLVETVAEQGEDMQGYVTELLLTLEAAVDSLESDFRPLDFMKEIFKSTPNLNNKDGSMIISGPNTSGLNGNNHVNPTGCMASNIGGKRSPMGAGAFVSMAQSGHARSTSYSVSYCMRKTTASPSSAVVSVNNADPKELMRGRTTSELEARSISKYSTNLSRSRSAQSLKLLGDTATQDDKMTILAQLFWLAVSLLESDYEHEFLLALRLLSRVMHRLPLDRPDARDKVEKLQAQLKWNGFPGVHALLLKGCTSPNTYEPVVTLLSQFTPLLDLPVVDPTQSLAFPMNVVALLPYMLLNYEDANELCIRSAENIAQVSTEKSKKLENLATVMTLYSRRTFSKESFQWTKCVVKYLYDTYAHLSLNMLTFLVEVLEKGSTSCQQPILSIVHCILHYVDLGANTQIQPINADLLRVIAKYIEGPHYKEALKILKLVVTRSSTLVAPPTSIHVSHWDHSSFSDSEVFTKKELPGRTMDFTFDLSQTPVIGRRFLIKPNIGGSGDEKTFSAPASVSSLGSGLCPSSGAGDGPGNTSGSSLVTGLGASPRRSVSLSPADSASIAGWKRPWMSQGRVRECLVNLLTTCGQRVGLPKSPSVIFSQSSDLMERQSSMASSTEEVSGPNDLSGGSRRDDAATEQFGVFRDFDFLEYESESVEGESTDNFNWGVRRRPLSDGETEPNSLRQQLEESFSEKTPTLGKRSKAGDPVESSDDERGSESPLDEVVAAPEYLGSGLHVVSGNGSNSTSGLVGGNGANVYPPSSLSLREHHRTRHDSGTRSDTSCLSSGGSSTGGDLGDVTPCNASPNVLSSLASSASFRPISRDDAEDSWRLQLQTLLDRPSPNELFAILQRLLKDIVNKVVIICHDASDCLGSTLSHPLSQVIELLTCGQCEAPHVWLSSDLQVSPPTKLIESLRFGLLEVQEHWETYLDRCDHVSECIDSVKDTIKLNLLGEPASDLGSDELALDLSKAIYKLLFQLLLLLEAYNKMLIALTSAISPHSDLSSEVGRAKICLNAAGGSGPGTPTASPRETEASLLELLQADAWTAALRHARTHRGVAPEDEDPTAAALNALCRHLAAEKTDVLVVTKTDKDLSFLFTKLRENLFQMLEAVKNLDGHLKENRDTSLRKTDC